MPVRNSELIALVIWNRNVGITALKMVEIDVEKQRAIRFRISPTLTSTFWSIHFSLALKESSLITNFRSKREFSIGKVEGETQLRIGKAFRF